MKNSNSILLMKQYNLTLAFRLEPEAEAAWSRLEADGDPVREGSNSDDVLYQSDGYLLKVTTQKDEQNTIIDFSLKRPDDNAFTVHNYEIECLVPVIDMYNVSPMFLGYAHRQHSNPATFRSSCTSKDAPYVMYGSRSGENRFTIGLENLVIETEVTRRSHGTGTYYDSNLIRFVRPVDGVVLSRKELKDAIFISDFHKSWFHVTRDYWDWIDKRRHYIPNPTPESTYGPIWCSWFYLTDIDEEKIWENAKIAKDLGIKTITIDAGWFCSDTEIPFPDSPLNNDTFGFGRIDADRTKFPDMANLVGRIHRELGLFVWAWATPRWIFKAVESGEKRVDKKLLDCRVVNAKGQTLQMLCTRNPGAREHAAKFTSYVVGKYGFDGLKFDCWEFGGEMDICTADHEHTCDTMGEGTVAWAKGVYEAMTAMKHDAVVWFNNTTLKPFSNHSTSPNEVYCQPDELWRMSVLMKTFIRGISSQLSEGSWHPSEPVQTLTRQLAILMMGHSPEIQVDLTKLPEEHKRVIKAWFAFYNAHRKELIWGIYEPFGFENTLGGPNSVSPPHVKIESGEEAFVWLGPSFTGEVRLTNNPTKVYLFNIKSVDGISINLTGLPQGNVLITLLDPFMQVIRQRMASCSGKLELCEDLKVGCMLSICNK